jgi:hypothetical protein
MSLTGSISSEAAQLALTDFYMQIVGYGANRFYRQAQGFGYASGLGAGNSAFNRLLHDHFFYLFLLLFCKLSHF